MPANLALRYPTRATSWRLRTRTLHFTGQPLLMGIVNVTPDSFSDGGKFLDRPAAVDHALRLGEEGAYILDIGGESTRPNADPVSADEEAARVIPVIAGTLLKWPNAIVSIDTSKAEVARVAIELGVEIVNDVTGLTGDPAMIDVVKDSGVGVCVMHMQGTPRTMQERPTYGDVVVEIKEYLRQRRDALAAAGFERERICLDPGIGFGKTHQHNITLMARCGEFHELGCPLLVGHSRKGFIGKLIGDKEADRSAGTIGGALALAAQGVHTLRVHDVLAVRQALAVFAACGGTDEWLRQIE